MWVPGWVLLGWADGAVEPEPSLFAFSCLHLTQLLPLPHHRCPQRPENVSEQWMFRHPGSRARLAEALGAGWLLLQQYTGSLSYEQTRRYLKQWAAYQVCGCWHGSVWADWHGMHGLFRVASINLGTLDT